MKKLALTILCGTLIGGSFAAHATTTHKKHSYKGEAGSTMTRPAAEPLGTLTGNFDFTTNYIFRGISNSNNLPAVQGGLTYTFNKTGIYFNLWGSNVYFVAPDQVGSIATVEFDTIAGVTNPIGDNFKYDINIARYNYPKASAANYNEVNLNFYYSFLLARLGYSSNVYGTHKNGEYYEAGVNFGIPPEYFFHVNDVAILATAGHYTLPRTAGLFSYNNVLLQISKTIGSYVLALQWTNTARANMPPVDGSHIVGTVTVNF